MFTIVFSLFYSIRQGLRSRAVLQAIKQIEHRPRATPFQHGQLLSQQEVFKDEIPAVTEDAKERPNASQSTLSIIGVITEFWQRAGGYVIDFKDGQSFGEAHPSGLR